MNMKKSFVAFCTSAILGLAAALPSSAADFVLVNLDPAGKGFNDPTPATPVGGNPGTTVGQQRIIAYSRALQLWGSMLKSNVPIVVLGSFAPRSCTPTSGVLASAGAWNIERDFANAPLAHHWYHSALVNSIAGTDITADANPFVGADIVAIFNSQLGTAACLTTSHWYYGLDSKANAGAGETDFLNVFMHELSHGLGFSNFVSEDVGNDTLEGLPDVFMANTLDTATGKLWSQMTPAEIVAAAVRNGKEVWVGPTVTANAPLVLGRQVFFTLSAPASLAGQYEFGTSSTFGAVATPANFSGPIVTGLSPTNDGCNAFTNAADVAGKIAIVRRGTCGFVVKAKNAQNAGATGVIIANNQAGGAIGLGGADPTVTIPAISISQDLGDAFFAAGGAGQGGLVEDPTRLAGADEHGHVRLYAPTVVALGSTASHFDTVAEPSLLMEPAITAALHASLNVDLTAALFKDIGWTLELNMPGCGPVADAEAVSPTGDNHAGQIFLCADAAKNKGAFQSCVAQHLGSLNQQGVISGAAKGSVGSCYAGFK
jgi:hypothetical protein